MIGTTSIITIKETYRCKVLSSDKWYWSFCLCIYQSCSTSKIYIWQTNNTGIQRAKRFWVRVKLFLRVVKIVTITCFVFSLKNRHSLTNVLFVTRFSLLHPCFRHVYVVATTTTRTDLIYFHKNKQLHWIYFMITASVYIFYWDNTKFTDIFMVERKIFC